MAKKEYGTRKKYHYIYKTTNTLSGRYYIGMHSTDDLNDGYLGSGTLLRRSINKHGKENHSIEILEYLNSREELAAREREIVSLQEIAKKECMNLKVGGDGGFTLEQARNGGKLSGARHAEKMKNDPEFKKRISEGVGRASKERFLQDRVNYPLVKHRADWTGRNHSQESIAKMQEVKKGHGKGSENSQYGKPRSEETKQKIRESLKKTRELKNNINNDGIA
jgi:hypothetical protein